MQVMYNQLVPVSRYPFHPNGTGMWCTHDGSIQQQNNNFVKKPHTSMLQETRSGKHFLNHLCKPPTGDCVLLRAVHQCLCQRSWLATTSNPLLPSLLQDMTPTFGEYGHSTVSGTWILTQTTDYP